MCNLNFSNSFSGLKLEAYFFNYYSYIGHTNFIYYLIKIFKNKNILYNYLLYLFIYFTNNGSFKIMFNIFF